MKPSNPWLTAARYHPDLFDCIPDNDHAELPAGAAILERCAPFIGKAIVVGLFGLVAGICAVKGWGW
jgi:hypothetical protein